ncbi:MAG: hypothetical protein LC647_14910 [Beggiatoa sp.]|nr:hypothetical protein [Beggiatoa sp.]
MVARPAPSSPGADNWVNHHASGPMKRLTIDIDLDKHKRFKSLCAALGLKMADEIRHAVDRRIADLQKKGEGAA